MSMTKDSAAYQRWAEERAEANSYEEYLDTLYWQQRQASGEEGRAQTNAGGTAQQQQQ